MFTDFERLLATHDRILILRHQNPDLDALGSQFGLAYALRTRFPDKTVRVAGDTNALNHFGTFDEPTDDDYRASLVVILDTVSRQMLAGDRYLLAETLVLIDHHRNVPDIRYDLLIQDPDASSTAELLAGAMIAAGWLLPKPAAEALYEGVVADTGRFLYRNLTPTTFRIAAELLERGADAPAVYDRMYAEPLAMKKLKSAFAGSIALTLHNVAYRRNDQAFLDRYGVDANTVSRGLVNQMAGIDEVPIWANFTYDRQSGKILCELRSRKTPILEVAKRFGGGGHLQACGCLVDTWEDTELVLRELDRLTEVK